MKTMKLISLTLLVLVVFNSCQNEVFEITNEQQESMLNNQPALNILLLDLASESPTLLSTSVSIEYPITVSRYNIDYQFLDAQTISNDTELTNSIKEMNSSVLKRINYPITLNYRNGKTIAVNSNIELRNGIDNASENVFSSSACITEELFECTYNDGVDDIIFNLQEADNSCEYLTIQGNEFYSTFEDLVQGTDPISDPTKYKTVNSSIVYLKHYITSIIDNFQVFEINLTIKDCECYEGREITLEDVNGNGFQVFDLTSAFNGCNLVSTLSVSYHTSFSDAENVLDAISDPTEFTNTSAYCQTIYVAIWDVSSPDTAETIFELNLIVSND